jgi:hypothetical protein
MSALKSSFLQGYSWRRSTQMRCQYIKTSYYCLLPNTFQFTYSHPTVCGHTGPNLFKSPVGTIPLSILIISFEQFWGHKLYLPYTDLFPDSSKIIMNDAVAQKWKCIMMDGVMEDSRLCFALSLFELPQPFYIMSCKPIPACLPVMLNNESFSFYLGLWHTLIHYRNVLSKLPNL